MGRLEPAQHLALGHRDGLQRRYEVADPGPRRQHQPSRFIRAPRGGDAHAAAGDWRPVEHPFVRMDLGAGGHRQAGMGDDRALRQHEATVRLEHGGKIVRQAITGKAGIDLSAGQNVVRQAMLAAGFARAQEDVAVGGAGVQRPGGDEQLLAGGLRRLAPQFEGALEQRHIGRVLVIGEADDARDAVRGALCMGDVEAFEPEHPFAAAGQLPARRRAHAADPDHDHVVAVACHAFSPGSPPHYGRRRGEEGQAVCCRALARQSLMRPGRGAGTFSSAGWAKKNSA